MWLAMSHIMKNFPSQDVMSSEAAKPTHDEIAALAYNLYKDRGCQAGHDKEDWIYAEQLLTGQITLEAIAKNAPATPPSVLSHNRRRAVRAL